MVNVQGKPMAVVCAAAVALAVPSWSTSVRAVDRVSAGGADAPAEQWNSFSADVTIRRGLRDADHKAIGDEAPSVHYRWRRVQSDGYWKSTMEVVSSTRAAVKTTSGQEQAIPPAVGRVEDPGDGTGPRFFTSSGREVQAPRLEDREKLREASGGLSRADAMIDAFAMLDSGRGRARTEGRAWVDAVMPGSDRKQARRESLQRRFGRAAGKVRGLARYVAASGAETIEWLVDDEWNVPVEMNVVRDGGLQEHATFVYEAGPGRALVRRGAHVEHVIPQAGGARMALDVEIANVSVTNVALESGR